MANYVERTTNYDLDDEQEVEKRLLYHAENEDLKPWTLVEKVSNDTDENNEDVRSKMKEMVWKWDLQIRAGGNIGIDRHE